MKQSSVQLMMPSIDAMQREACISTIRKLLVGMLAQKVSVCAYDFKILLGYLDVRVSLFVVIYH
jgi:hypothetical protein